MKLLSLDLKDIPWTKSNAKMPFVVVCPCCECGFKLAMGDSKSASVICTCGTHIEITVDKHKAIEVVEREAH